jgi:hypothetical protein
MVRQDMARRKKIVMNQGAAAAPGIGGSPKIGVCPGLSAALQPNYSPLFCPSVPLCVSKILVGGSVISLRAI